MKSNNSKMKIVCPVCEGQLAIWYEMSIEYSQKIDPSNGSIMKRISKSDLNKTDIHGIKCTKCDYFESGNDLSDEAQIICELINFDNLNSSL
ncbi:hypothetical protein [Acinetobacter modestus]|uniref:hypothetical protein n=1 Tax=Acinetobacter modestus TaxID=1776740 RepID=UPI00301B1912